MSILSDLFDAKREAGFVEAERWAHLFLDECRMPDCPHTASEHYKARLFLSIKYIAALKELRELKSGKPDSITAAITAGRRRIADALRELVPHFGGPGAALLERLVRVWAECDNLRRVCALNQSDAIYAQQRAAFLTKMLDKERAENERLRAGLLEACNIASIAIRGMYTHHNPENQRWAVPSTEAIAELRKLAGEKL